MTTFGRGKYLDQDLAEYPIFVDGVPVGGLYQDSAGGSVSYYLTRRAYSKLRMETYDFVGCVSLKEAKRIVVSRQPKLF